MRNNDFECHLRFERQLTDATINNYLFFLAEFKKFAGKELICAEKEDIRDFIKYLLARGISKASVSNYVIALRAYYNWLADVNQTEKIISLSFFLTKIIKVKRQYKVTVVPTHEEVKRLREVLALNKMALSFNKKAEKYKTILRDTAIIELLITSGIRSNELRNLILSDIDLSNDTVLIRCGKGGKQRVSLFNGTARSALQEYIENNQFMDTEKLFPFKQGNLVNYIIKRWAKRAGINEKIHAHSFRHYFITESYRQGVPMEAVADQVGHSSLSTTRGYTHFSLEVLKEKFKDFKN